jgi:hypothetical protein
MLLSCYEPCGAQLFLSPAEKDLRSADFAKSKIQLGFGLGLKVDLIRGELGYYRLSATFGGGVPFGKDTYLFNKDKKLKDNNFIFYYLAEIDIFRGGLGASSGSLNNQNFVFELRQSFLTSVGTTGKNSNLNFNRPVVHFISNSSRPLLDPFAYSVTFGTTFINTLNLPRSQRVGILNLGLGLFGASYLNDGPPFNFHNNFLPFGDGYDRWWTGSGMIGMYGFSQNSRIRQLELKFDKFTGLQPYGYEVATALKLKHIPYQSKEAQLYNRQRIEFNALTQFGLGFNLSFYDNPKIDVQHLIHLKNFYSYHNTPLKPQSFITGLSYFSAIPIHD